MSDNELPVEIDPRIETRLKALERLQQEAVLERVAGLEQKMAAIPAQLQQATEAAKAAAEYANGIRRLVLHGPAAGRWLRNVVGLGGLTAMTTGLWWIEPAVSLIVTGGLCVTMVVVGILLGAKRRESRND